jgi:hypothetical protein
MVLGATCRVVWYGSLVGSVRDTDKDLLKFLVTTAQNA